MFRISNTCLILKNVSNGKFIYKYPFENLIFINSNPQFTRKNFPELKTIFLFNQDESYNIKLKPSLETLMPARILLDGLSHPNLITLSNVQFVDPAQAEEYKKIFLYGCFSPVKDLSRYSTNKLVQDQIDYYSEWLNK